MALPSTSFFPQIALLTITSLSLLSSSLPSTTPPPFKKIYAFGNSYTDTGNTQSTTGPSGFNYVSNLPYGRTFFRRPTNRYSDGRLVIDFIAHSLSLPFLPPYLNPKADTSKGVNFAVAGSTAIRHTFFVKNNLTLNITPQSLQTQLNWFNKTLEAQGCNGNSGTSSQCCDAISDALFWVGEIGANDYAYTVGSDVSSSTIQRLAIKSVTGFLQALLTKGAKYIVVQGLPTTGCLPLALYLSPKDDRDDIGCVRSVNYQSHAHNAILQSQLQVFRKQFPQSTIVYADYWNAYRTIMKSPSKYGFVEPFKACCGSGGGPYNYQVSDACGSPASSSCSDPNKYINWDGVHLTEGMYKVLSELFLNGSFTYPPFEDLLRRKMKEIGM